MAEVWPSAAGREVTATPDSEIFIDHSPRSSLPSPQHHTQHLDRAAAAAAMRTALVAETEARLAAEYVEVCAEMHAAAVAARHAAQAAADDAARAECAPAYEAAHLAVAMMRRCESLAQVHAAYHDAKTQSTAEASQAASLEVPHHMREALLIAADERARADAAAAASMAEHATATEFRLVVQELQAALVVARAEADDARADAASALVREAEASASARVHVETLACALRQLERQRFVAETKNGRRASGGCCGGVGGSGTGSARVQGGISPRAAAQLPRAPSSRAQDAVRRGSGRSRLHRDDGDDDGSERWLVLQGGDMSLRPPLRTPPVERADHSSQTLGSHPSSSRSSPATSAFFSAEERSRSASVRSAATRRRSVASCSSSLAQPREPAPLSTLSGGDGSARSPVLRRQLEAVGAKRLSSPWSDSRLSTDSSLRRSAAASPSAFFDAEPESGGCRTSAESVRSPHLEWRASRRQSANAERASVGSGLSASASAAPTAIERLERAAPPIESLAPSKPPDSPTVRGQRRRALSARERRLEDAIKLKRLVDTLRHVEPPPEPPAARLQARRPMRGLHNGRHHVVVQSEGAFSRIVPKAAVESRRIEQRPAWVSTPRNGPNGRGAAVACGSSRPSASRASRGERTIASRCGRPSRSVLGPNGEVPSWPSRW